MCFYLFFYHIDIIIILYFSPIKHSFLKLLNYQLHIIEQHECILSGRINMFQYPEITPLIDQISVTKSDSGGSGVSVVTSGCFTLCS